MINSDLRGYYLRLWSHISRRRRVEIIALFFLIFASSLVEVVSIGMVFPFLGLLTEPDLILSQPFFEKYRDYFLLIPKDEMIFLVTSIFAMVTIFAGGIRFSLTWFQIKLSFLIGADLGSEIYRRTLFQPYAIHISRNSSQVITGITMKTNSVVGSTLTPTLMLINSLVLMIFVFLAFLLISPKITIALFLSVSLIYLAIFRFFSGSIKYNGKEISDQQTKVVKALSEGLGAIRDVLIDSTQEYYCRIYKDAESRLRSASASLQILSTTPRHVIETLGIFSIAMIAYYFSSQEKGLSYAIPMLGVLALGAQRLLPIIQTAYSSWTTIKGGIPSLVDALAFLDQPMPPEELSKNDVSMPFEKSITLNSLYFKYDEARKFVFKGVDLILPKGGIYGFYGKTGNGKSTFLDLILGLLQPSGGSIMVDSQVLDSSTTSLWQKKIAHVPQFIYLADSSLAENIAFGVPHAKIDYSRLNYAIQGAEISDLVVELPNGLSTLVGERGVRLSGGQRQRVGIARALYKGAEVLILDEATSALDTETESRVMNSIKKMAADVTLLIVAHRVSTFKDCDLIYKIENQSITPIGKYCDLVNQPVHNPIINEKPTKNNE